MITTAPPARTPPNTGPVTLFVGRQPIFDRDLDTFAYELLFRNGAGATSADVVDGGTATARVLVNAVTEIGLNNLVGSKRAFVNLTEHFIVHHDLLAALPPERVVLEVLENVPPTPEVIDGLMHLAELGYTIAMDDFIYSPLFEPALQHVKIIKYDYADTQGLKLRRRIAEDHRAGRLVVVERIETHLEHRDAELAGADFFQGYFFAKPKTLSVQSVPPSRLTLLQLLARVNDPDATTDEIVSILTQDVSMSVKTLRYVNSAATGVTNTIDSIERAAILLGRDTLRSWTSLTLMASMNDQPSELLGLALWRAKACENIARYRQRPNPSSYYAVGMLSLLDVITGTTMEDVLRDLSLSDEIRACLLGEPSPLADVLQQVVDLERADREHTHLDVEPCVLDAHQRALVWANGLVSSADTRT
jgi:EAL and modified HD-GYP domain-containing signal transduction protein